MTTTPDAVELSPAQVVATVGAGLFRRLSDDLARELTSPNMELRPDGREDPVTAAYVDGIRQACAYVDDAAANFEALLENAPAPADAAFVNESAGPSRG